MSKASPVRRRPRYIRFIPVIIIVAGGAAFAIRSRLAARHAVMPPKTIQAFTGDIRILVSETGTIEPMQKVDVRSKVAGRLISLLVQEGQHVTRGQLIAIVDRSQIDPQIAKQRALVEQSQAHLQQSQTSYDLQVSQSRVAILQAQADLKEARTHLALVSAGARPQELAKQDQSTAQAQITLDDSLRTLKRKQALLAKGYVPQTDVDTAQVAVDTAKANLEAQQQSKSLLVAGPRKEEIDDAKMAVEQAQVRLATARANVPQDEVRRADIAQARAGVQQSNQDLAQLEVNLADTKIVAPASGTVLKRYKQLDEIVQSATTGFSDTQSLIATLGSRQEIRVDVNEIDVPKVHLGAPVTIHVDAIPGVEYLGTVTEIAPASTTAFSDTSSTGSSNGVSRFTVKVLLNSDDSRLRSGMSASVDILSAAHKHVVLLPVSALPATGITTSVTVVGPGNKQSSRAVKIGLRDDVNAEVVSGLKPGEAVLVPTPPPSDRRTFKMDGG